MKKLLIALPLVLIMVLTMIPVMAQETGLVYEVPVSYTLKDNKNVEHDMTTKVMVSEADAADEAKLKEVVGDQLKKLHPGYLVAVEVAAVDGQNVTKPSVKTAVLTFDFEAAYNADNDGRACSEWKITIKNVVTDKVIDSSYLSNGTHWKNPYTHTYKKNGKPVKVTGDVALQDFIDTVYNEVPWYFNNFQLLPGRRWFGDNMPGAGVLGDCEATLYVLPRWELVTIGHEFYTCEFDADGSVVKDAKPRLVKVLMEDARIDFIDWNTTLQLNPEKVAEYAKTRVQTVNIAGTAASNFVFQKAYIVQKANVSRYLDQIHALNGELVVYEGDLVNKLYSLNRPSYVVVIEYMRAECLKADEKVDNATVGANNAGTTANTATASGAQLPATGVKDMTAFFMSAVALLGLGIFFAKKH